MGESRITHFFFPVSAIRNPKSKASVHKPRGDVAENQRVVILAGLVSNNPGVTAVHRIELIFSSVGDPG